MGLTRLGPSLTSSDVGSRSSPANFPGVRREQQSGGWPEATEQETAKLQAGCSLFLAIPHSITTSPFSQIGGNNGPAWLGLLVREPNLLWNQAGTLAEKPTSTQRSWWIRDLFNIGGLTGVHFSKDLSAECRWEGSFIVVSFHICGGFCTLANRARRTRRRGL